ncbi:WecB/TagA/CpsF family glycosyltransferase [Flammeovirga sp. MY04]|uniref:WecB/TagA/CpsF family glycosyltransferase n=1 Tax=Flammeovirga sp. MY04 TaxID=1191459 RepID=UPI000806380D|nr:WecB/TagA/CpsF family glycosyltransferase [Flammeovirga sp. MY04]ANQ50226.1 WecB/TagA/CpsF family glycosyltransferase [Flammeovirga sp. MY04]
MKKNNLISLILRDKNNPQTFTFLNPASYVEARKHLDIYTKIDKIYIDGIGLLFFLKLFNKYKEGRKSFDMTSLGKDIFSQSVIQNRKIYIIGSTQESIEKFVSNIKKEFEGVNIIGFRNGYIKGEEQNVINEIINKEPDITIVGMGVPIQEHFLVELKKCGYKNIIYTCGGFIHQTTENIHFYPEWIDKLNLRMFYRIYAEPEFRKKLPNYLKFILYFFIDLLTYIKNKDYLNHK